MSTQLPAVRTSNMRTTRDFIEHLARLSADELADRAESLGLASDAFSAPWLLRFTARIEFGPGCWLWHGPRQGAGYGNVSVRGTERGTTRGTHRIAYVLGHGPLEHRRAKVLHSCDEPQCVNPAHLRSGTAADNMADASARGRLHHARVLTEAERLVHLPLVAARYRQAGASRAVTFAQVAAMFGVSADYASRLHDRAVIAEANRLADTLAGEPLPFYSRLVV